MPEKSYTIGELLALLRLRRDLSTDDAERLAMHACIEIVATYMCDLETACALIHDKGVTESVVLSGGKLQVSQEIRQMYTEVFNLVADTTPAASAAMVNIMMNLKDRANERYEDEETSDAERRAWLLISAALPLCAGEALQWGTLQVAVYLLEDDMRQTPDLTPLELTILNGWLEQARLLCG